VTFEKARIGDMTKSLFHAGTRYLGTALITLLAVSCARIHRNPVPVHLINQAQVAGIPNARTLIDPSNLSWQELSNSLADAAVQLSKAERPPVLLAISGGGEKGAFAVGVLCGWTEAGNRPQFDVVTGISTGALIAPLAFLGFEYDSELKEAYTSIDDSDVFKKRKVFGILRRDAAASSKPLADLIRRHFDPIKMERVAREHRKGRRLFIGTSHLDADQLVVWDMGAIACSEHPHAYDLFCNILLASASIPVALPPVYIEVEAEGKSYDEMHVDGGVTTQVFGALVLSQLSRLSGQDGGQIFLIRNASLIPAIDLIKPRLTAIAGRSITILLKTQGLGDLYRTFTIAHTTNLEFNLASIPEEFDAQKETKQTFDPFYMKALFEKGYNLARHGYPWGKVPPGFLGLDQ